MIWKIAKKEFLLNLMTFKFAVGTIVCVVLITVFMPILVGEYQADFKEYIRSRDAEDLDSLHLIFDEEQCARSWKTISHKPVDFDTVPKFQERDLAIGQSLKLTIWDVGLLVLFNLVFFAASFVSFLRYDVR
jgi:ABC-type transport system involved in multi-copper enzyme maturation permease subunit